MLFNQGKKASSDVGALSGVCVACAKCGPCPVAFAISKACGVFCLPWVEVGFLEANEVSAVVVELVQEGEGIVRALAVEGCPAMGSRVGFNAFRGQVADPLAFGTELACAAVNEKVMLTLFGWCELPNGFELVLCGGW